MALLSSVEAWPLQQILSRLPEHPVIVIMVRTTQDQDTNREEKGKGIHELALVCRSKLAVLSLSWQNTLGDSTPGVLLLLCSVRTTRARMPSQSAR